jgi:ribonuclease-3
MSSTFRLSETEVAKLPGLIPFKYPKTREQVFTHRSYSARPSAVFEDAVDDIAPDNEVLEHAGDAVLNLAVVTLVRRKYR